MIEKYENVIYNGKVQTFRFVGFQGTRERSFAIYKSNLGFTLCEDTIKKLPKESLEKIVELEGERE